MRLTPATFLFLIATSAVATHGNAKQPNYPKVSVWQPVTVHINDTHEVIQLYCKTKNLTNVHLPLTGPEVISEIMLGDDERVWSVHGKQTRVFTTKPSNLAWKTTAAVRTTAGKVYHFRLHNIAYTGEYKEFETREEQQAFHAMLRKHQGYDPYHNVVVAYRDNQIPVQETARLEAMKQELEAGLERLKRAEEALKAKESRMEQQFQEQQVQFTRHYAAGIDTDYRVQYKKRRWFWQKRKARIKVRVFSDGTFTWIQLPKGVAGLHVYELRENGRYEVVNFVNRDNLYRIDRVANNLEFRNQAKGDWLFRVKKVTHGR
ncbi:MAG: TrbG/VirB9 family P-type conjugative transfer protein [Acidobacteriota bacterium]|nr:TrbG/VirB9 family P-type conjugative transfer protein [Acidobacteriota bacterium]